MDQEAGHNLQAMANSADVSQGNHFSRLAEMNIE